MIDDLQPWRDLTEAADANALAHHCGQPSPSDELMLLLALHNRGEQGGYIGLRDFHALRARQIADPEWKAAHTTAHDHYEKKALEVAAELDVLPEALVGPDEEMGKAERILRLAELLGDTDPSGRVASAWREVRSLGQQRAARSLAVWLLGCAEQHDYVWMSLLRRGLISMDEYARGCRVAFYLEYLHATASTDADGAEVYRRLRVRVDAAVALGDAVSLAAAELLVVGVVGEDAPAWLLDRLELARMWRTDE